MPEQTAAEYAERYGLSVRRVQAAAASGALPARQVAGRWMIDLAHEHRPVARRALSPRMRAALLARLNGNEAPLAPSERVRLNRHITELCEAEQAPDLLRAWLRDAPPLRLDALPQDVADLADDERISPTGFSDPRAGIAAAGQLEARVADADLQAILDEYVLEPSERPTVLLHVVSERPSRPIPQADLLADLAQHGGSRERSQVARLVTDWIKR